MNNYKPIFYNEKLLFYREEKNGYMLISLKEFPELREMVINRTMWEIFLLCDGNNTLADILDIIVARYNDVNYETVKKDTALVLSKFARLGVIKWENDDDPYIVSNETLCKSGYKIRLIREKDFKLLLDYLESVDKNCFYTFAQYLETDYTDINLRAKIFYRLEDFYMLINANDIIECVVGISNNQSAVFKVANLTFISNTKDIEKSSFLLSFLCNTYNDNALKTVLKIRAIIDSNNDNKHIKSILTQVGFIKETTLMNELGKNHGVDYFSFYYN